MNLTILLAILLAVCVIIIIVMYVRLVRPIRALNIGVNLLREQDFNTRVRHVGQKDADNVAAIFNRMMETLKEERIRTLELNRFLDTLIDASPLGIIILGFDGGVVSANRAARAFLGSSSPEGKMLTEMPGEIAGACAALAEGEPRTLRTSATEILRLSRLSFLDSGFHRPFILIEALTDEVRRAEKEAYGKIIRQISHEVSNTMAGSISMLDAIAMSVPDSDIAEALDACRDRWQSLSKFITAYADMVKLAPPTLTDVDARALIEGLTPFLESLTSGRDIRLTVDLPEAPVMITADSVQLEQVLVNVVKNSAESIGSGGNIAIRLTSASLTVTDDGHGISADAAGRLFTPFFSTKTGGQGIGLMLVSEILHAHSFPFSLTTPEPRKTVFEMRFS